MAWLRGILELQKDNPNFLETLKVDIFGDKIYCYTPKGDIKELPKGASIMDIGMGTLASYKRILRLARTVFWAGPVGKFEDKRFARGTKEIAFCIARSNAISIVGGGDTSAAVDQFGVARRFTHISSGGGASLAVVEGKKLPGIAALEESYRKFKKAP